MKKRNISKIILLSIFALFLPEVIAAGTNPQVVSGDAKVTNIDTVTTVNQNSKTATIHWDELSLAGNESLVFDVPTVSSVSINRVIGDNPSDIQGQISSLGNVILINKNGIAFDGDLILDTHSFIASTLDLQKDYGDNSKYDFRGKTSAYIQNNGKINTNGTLAFMAPYINQNGLIIAKKQKVNLTSGDELTLDFAGDNLISFTASDKSGFKGSINSTGDIQNAAGIVVMQVQSARDVLSSSINLTGLVNVDNVIEDGDEIILCSGAISLEADNLDLDVLADLRANGSHGADAGKIELTGHNKLNMQASVTANATGSSGDGGFIKLTSNKAPNIDGSFLQAKSNGGKKGEVDLDPTDYEITPSVASNIQTILNGGTDVTVSTANSGTDEGDITVNGNITWTTDSDLKLLAHRNINFGSFVIHSNGGGRLVLHADKSGICTGEGNCGQINFSDDATVNLVIDSVGTLDIYYRPQSAYPSGTYDLVNRKSFLGKASPSEGVVFNSYALLYEFDDLNTLSNRVGSGYDKTADFALAKDISDPATAAQRADMSFTGFTPIGNSTHKFAGNFDGNCHTIDKLHIRRPADNYNGLFGYTDTAKIKNLKFTDAYVQSKNYAGVLIGRGIDNSVVDNIKVDNSKVEYDGTAFRNIFGAVIGGYTDSTATRIKSTNNIITAYDQIGGIVGITSNSSVKQSFIDNVEITTEDNNGSQFGGIVGGAYSDSIIEDCYVINSKIRGTRGIGGIVGYFGGDNIVRHNYIANTELNGTYMTTTPTLFFGEVGTLVGETGSGAGVEIYENIVAESTTIVYGYPKDYPQDQSVTATKFVGWTGGGTPINVTDNEYHTTVEMTDKLNFEDIDFDFTNTWKINTGQMPILKGKIGCEDEFSAIAATTLIIDDSNWPGFKLTLDSGMDLVIDTTNEDAAIVNILLNTDIDWNTTARLTFKAQKNFDFGNYFVNKGTTNTGSLTVIADSTNTCGSSSGCGQINFGSGGVKLTGQTTDASVDFYYRPQDIYPTGAHTLSLGKVFPITQFKATTAAEGAGSEHQNFNPYMWLYDYTDLKSLSSNVSSGISDSALAPGLETTHVPFNYALFSNITAPDGDPLTPIGSSSHKFKGDFDGNCKVITNLVIDQDTDDAAMFGYTDSAKIKNIVLVKPTVEGDTNVSALIGNQDESTKVSGIQVIDANIKGLKNVGTIAGKMGANSTIDKVSVIGSTVTGGGIIPFGETVAVKDASEVGGIAGLADNNNTISKASVVNTKVHNIAYSPFSDIKDNTDEDAAANYGGILGKSNTNVALVDTYVKDSIIEAVKNTGALIGNSGTSQSINNSIATNVSVHTENSGAGLIGRASAAATIEDSYINSDKLFASFLNDKSTYSYLLVKDIPTTTKTTAKLSELIGEDIATSSVEEPATLSDSALKANALTSYNLITIWDREVDNLPFLRPLACTTVSSTAESLLPLPLIGTDGLPTVIIKVVRPDTLNSFATHGVYASHGLVLDKHLYDQNKIEKHTSEAINPSEPSVYNGYNNLSDVTKPVTLQKGENVWLFDLKDNHYAINTEYKPLVNHYLDEEDHEGLASFAESVTTGNDKVYKVRDKVTKQKIEDISALLEENNKADKSTMLDYIKAELSYYPKCNLSSYSMEDKLNCIVSYYV